MTDRAHKVLEDALTLSDDERLDLADQLLSSLPPDPEWLAELEHPHRGRGRGLARDRPIRE
jgi:hypothetical protein